MTRRSGAALSGCAAPWGGAAVLLAMALMAVAPAVRAQNLPVPPLRWDYDALEPHVPEATMRVHHLGHHAAYTSKLNEVLAEMRADPEHKHLAKRGINRLLQTLDDVPERWRTKVRNAGGGYVNHELFFNNMAPNAGDASWDGDSALGRATVAAFGGLDGLKQAFTDKALSVFGSGYAWLVRDAAGELQVVGSANQDMPAAGLTPVLVLDVWEHAYYLDHKYRRPDFVKAWWNVVDWKEAARRYSGDAGAASEL